MLSGENHKVSSQHHSVEDLSTAELLQRRRKSETPEDVEPRARNVKWPQINNKAAWQQLDDDMDNILETTLVGNVEKKKACARGEQ